MEEAGGSRGVTFVAGRLRSNTFALEWPPRSGRMQEFPEVDRAGWFALPEAKRKDPDNGCPTRAPSGTA